MEIEIIFAFLKGLNIAFSLLIIVIFLRLSVGGKKSLKIATRLFTYAFVAYLLHHLTIFLPESLTWKTFDTIVEFVFLIIILFCAKLLGRAIGAHEHLLGKEKLREAKIEWKMK